MRYPALISGTEGSYQVVFPDLPGCAAEGGTIDEAVLCAEDAMRTWIAAMKELGQEIPGPSSPEKVVVPAGNSLISVLHVAAEPEKPSVRVNLVIDAGVLKVLDSEANRRKMSRKRYIEWMIEYVARTGG